MRTCDCTCCACPCASACSLVRAWALCCQHVIPRVFVLAVHLQPVDAYNHRRGRRFSPRNDKKTLQGVMKIYDQLLPPRRKLHGPDQSREVRVSSCPGCGSLEGRRGEAGPAQAARPEPSSCTDDQGLQSLMR
eukprot:4133561-Alexandrium_andersonii.AAC.1